MTIILENQSIQYKVRKTAEEFLVDDSYSKRVLFHDLFDSMEIEFDKFISLMRLFI